ncbi:MAG: putative acyl-CoA dehydrogenase [Polaromonas sp.]|jgi:acyl-CoA dehydrogenase|nr:putative acyl-CoA dehydrogenase [Polaromonas sp.]
MSDTLQEDLTAVRHEAQRLLRQQVSGDRLETLLDTPGGFDLELWQLVAAQGWPAVGLAEADGGAGLGWAGLGVLAEELGRAVCALPLMVGALAAEALAGCGDAQVQARWLPGLSSGDAKACLVLPGLRSGLLTQAPGLRSANGCLQGIVSTVGFAAIAEVALVVAEDDEQCAGLWLVALDAAGVSREIVTTIDDARAVATLRFAGAPAVRLGGEDSVAQLLDRAATLAAFEQIGGAQASLALAIEHALQREAFGQPIARFQGIKHKLVEIYSAIEIARGCALSALDLLGETQDRAGRHEAAATARVAASQAYEQAARDCINVFGALGVTREAAPHRHYRRARSLALELGSTPLWRESLVENFLARNRLTQGA